MKRQKMTTSSMTIVLLVWASIGVAMFGTGMAITDPPQFCLTCHEMHPFYDAWKQGPHKDIWCTECHVDSDMFNRVVHTLPVTKQVVYHVLNKGRYPLAEEIDVPSARCKRCHADMSAPTASGFEHALHAEHRCMECHRTAGHNVTVAALQAAGVYSGNRLPAKTVAHVGNGAANILGHKRVVCSNCHNMGALGCSACHSPRHKANAHYGSDCTRCHQPGVRFVFAHPNALPCAGCHNPPADHGNGRDCTTCHLRPGVSWAAAHPGAGPAKQCSMCHVIPPYHDESMRNCASCHRRPGITWTVAN